MKCLYNQNQTTIEIFICGVQRHFNCVILFIYFITLRGATDSIQYIVYTYKVETEHILC